MVLDGLDLDLLDLVEFDWVRSDSVDVLCQRRAMQPLAFFIVS